MSALSLSALVSTTIATLLGGAAGAPAVIRGRNSVRREGMTCQLLPLEVVTIRLFSCPYNPTFCTFILTCVVWLSWDELGGGTPGVRNSVGRLLPTNTTPHMRAPSGGPPTLCRAALANMSKSYEQRRGPCQRQEDFKLNTVVCANCVRVRTPPRVSATGRRDARWRPKRCSGGEVRKHPPPVGNTGLRASGASPIPCDPFTGGLDRGGGFHVRNLCGQSQVNTRVLPGRGASRSRGVAQKCR